MITFHGGPADGQTLALRRAPMFMRVVVDPAGKIDGLDQLSDYPAADEKVYVYRRRGGAQPMHVCGRGRGAASGWYMIADYVWLEDVDGEQVRRTQAWRDWCMTVGDQLALL